MKVRFLSRDKVRAMVMRSGDFFKCASCGYTVRMRVLGNTARCSQCGGTMHRT